MSKGVEEVQSQEQPESSPEVPLGVPDAQFINISALLLIWVDLNIPILNPQTCSRRIEGSLVVELEMDHLHTATSNLVKDLEIE